MIESVAQFPSVHLRHRTAPLLMERDRYLSHLLEKGVEASRVRSTASYLIHIVRILRLNSLRDVELSEIEQASKQWCEYRSPLRRATGMGSVPAPDNFMRIAKAWLSFHDRLIIPAVSRQPFDNLIADFEVELQSKRGLSVPTVSNYTKRTKGFLTWASESHDDLSLISVSDIDRFLTEKRSAGWKLTTIATQCQALRIFFGYAEERGLCRPGIVRGIASPRLPKYTDVANGPTWAEVRRLIASTKGDEPHQLRARAMFLLYAIYALRSSEVARLRLEDFDWRNETFTVRRSKRGGIQQYPIQYEVGQAIIDYLRKGRPRCTCRHIFVTLHLPYRPVGAAGMWSIVGKRLKKQNVTGGHKGPHSLRHACATRLLSKGSSLKEIAEYLGHRDTRSVGIYAKYDKKSLHNVAAFKLAGIR